MCVCIHCVHTLIRQIWICINSSCQTTWYSLFFSSQHLLFKMYVNIEKYVEMFFIIYCKIRKEIIVPASTRIETSMSKKKYKTKNAKLDIYAIYRTYIIHAGLVYVLEELYTIYRIQHLHTTIMQYHQRTCLIFVPFRNIFFDECKFKSNNVYGWYINEWTNKWMNIIIIIIHIDNERVDKSKINTGCMFSFTCVECFNITYVTYISYAYRNGNDLKAIFVVWEWYQGWRQKKIIAQHE